MLPETLPNLILIYNFHPPVPHIDVILLVGWEGVPLDVFELEKAQVEDHDKEHVKVVILFGSLAFKCCKVDSILEVRLGKLV